MSQQIGEGDDFGHKPSYGKSVEEAKALIKQLEAFKSLSSTSVDNVKESLAADEGKTAKNDVSFDIYHFIMQQ